VSYWAVARLAPHQERLALNHLARAGFMTYLPRLREWRRSHGRRIETRPPLFPGYCFFVVEAQWHAARWSVGIIGLIMDGIRPARVADAVIAEIRGREVGELIELAPPSPLRPGARVRILRGVFRDHLAVYADMKPRQRVEILLQLLGGEQRVTLAKKDIEVVR
jgi:transcriptional antiterminator RfaH